MIVGPYLSQDHLIEKICYSDTNNQWNLNEIGNGTTWKMLIK